MKSFESQKEIEAATFAAIKKLINKFRENPRYFFTESDLHSYFYHCLYSTRMEFKSNGIGLLAIHREYPTNFRYSKPELQKETFQVPDDPLSRKTGSRGHYDFAVLNPEFIENSELDWRHIRNKEIKLADKRKNMNTHSKDLLFALEFKYVIKTPGEFIKEVRADNNKLAMAKKTQCANAVNLVFCNLDKNTDAVKREVLSADNEILAVFINSYYDENNTKITPKPVTNNNTNAARLL